MQTGGFLNSEFVLRHGRLLRIYLEAQASGVTSDVLAKLAEERASILKAGSVSALVAYDRYHRLLLLLDDDSSLLQELRITDSSVFQALMDKDPSQPFALVGLAMCRRVAEDERGAAHLLRRVAISPCFERKDARRLLAGLEGMRVGKVWS